MARSGAALDRHAHDCLRVDHANGQWVAWCRCGEPSFGATLERAARKHSAHSDYAHLTDSHDDAGLIVAELALMMLAGGVWLVVFLAFAHLVTGAAT